MERDKEERIPGNPCWKDRAGICEGVPITFRIGDSPYSTNRTTVIKQSSRVSTYVPCIYAKFDPAPAGTASLKIRCVWYSPKTERERKLFVREKIRENNVC